MNIAVHEVHETRSLICDFGVDDYVSRIWHAGFADGTDIFAALWKRREDDAWQYRVRYRYDSGTDDPFDETDHKSCYAGIREGDEDALCAELDAFFRDKVIATAPSQCVSHDEVAVRAWGTEAFGVLTGQVWCHISFPPEGT